MKVISQKISSESNKIEPNIPPINLCSDQLRPVHVKQQKHQFNTTVLVTHNDGQRSSLKTLTFIKNLISHQLPKMPKNYITKIVFDQRHECLYLQQEKKVIGTACFRCFQGKNFVELVFLAVLQIYRENGLGSKIIQSLKQLLRVRGKSLLLTYADCTAVGFFQKQGFQFTVQDSSKQWSNYIKPYEGGRLMQCPIQMIFKYSEFRQNLILQKEHLFKTIKQIGPTEMKYKVKLIENIKKKQQERKKGENNGIDFSNLQVQEDIDLELIPGVLDNLWSKQNQSELQNQKEASVFLEQLYALECIRKLPSYFVTQIIQPPPAIAHLLSFQTIQRKINSNCYPSSQDLVKQLKDMLKQMKRWCPGQADDTFYQFSKKINAILDKLLWRKLQLKIQPIDRENKPKTSKQAVTVNK